MFFRLLQQDMSQAVGQNFVMDYRPGAGVRFSPHFYTADEQLEAAVSETKTILRTKAWQRHAAVKRVVT